MLLLYHDLFPTFQDMIILILATDMSRHAEILEAFKAKIDNFDFQSEDHITSLKMILIKACDISNECRPVMISEAWVECLLEEYFHQVSTLVYMDYSISLNDLTFLMTSSCKYQVY